VEDLDVHNQGMVAYQACLLLVWWLLAGASQSWLLSLTRAAVGVFKVFVGNLKWSLGRIPAHFIEELALLAPVHA
jgi:hypothetical protein